MRKLDWKHDEYGNWTSSGFEIELIEEGDGKWPPLVPPLRSYHLRIGNTFFGSCDTLEAAKAKAENLEHSTHPETAAAVRRARGLQPPYPVAEAVRWKE